VTPSNSTRFGAMAVAVLSAHAGAQPGRGQMGAQSGASIQISVSVAPRFSLGAGSALAKQRGRPANADGFELSSNAPALRYTVVPVSVGADPGSAEQETVLTGTARGEVARLSQPRLLLVVPD
jgi:hypothetical protein